MTTADRRALFAEALGTALLLAVIVGSGIMGAELAGGNRAIALLANALATGAALTVLISVFAPLSGAHFNPLVTVLFAVQRSLPWPLALGYIAAQLLGAIVGVWTAHLMFGLPLAQISTTLRSGPPQVFAEAVATLGLFVTILGASRFQPRSAPAMIGLYIASAYWFTASTAYANPAVAVARSLTDTFAGIAPVSLPGFLLGECLGAIVGAVTLKWLFAEEAHP